ncbi:hypothetical protein MAR_014471 [Mya arenaria]|uniref:Secreted protein n=1 Tax=Mya arenaria TaxID=6604 RepID=A0ABY7G636_MYAAR|nr:hypothetical protein MAR_014471 [Mya arenaria]
MAVWHVFVVVVALVPGLPTEKPPRGDTTGWKWTKEKPDHDGCLGGTRKHAYIERRFHEVIRITPKAKRVKTQKELQRMKY